MKWFWFSLIGFCLLLCACRTEYIPIEVVRVDSLYLSKLLRDSVFIRDSVYVKDSGDTVFVDKAKYVYVNKILVDTFYIERVKEVEVPVPVERKLSWWEQMKLDYAEWMFGMLVAVVLLMKLKERECKRPKKNNERALTAS